MNVEGFQVGSGDESEQSTPKNSPQDLPGEPLALGSSNAGEAKTNPTKGKPRGPRISLACKLVLNS